MVAEVRVHGVGDHDYSSALGSPEVEPSTTRAEVASPPMVPLHELKLVNWSRTSRGLSRGVWWYLAFPFTLVNSAGNMGGRSRALRVAVAVVGVLLTVAAATWAIVILESVLKYVPLPMDGEFAGRAMAFAVPIIIATTMVLRRLFKRTAVSRGLVGLHAAVLVAFGGVVAYWRPAQLAYTGWPASVAPDPDSGELVARLDAATAVVVLTTAATALIAIVIQATARNNPSVAAAAIVLCVAMALMHTVSSLIRMAADWLTSWASPIEANRPDTLSYGDRTLMAYYSKEQSYGPRLDIIPVFGVVAALMLLVATLLIIRYGPTGLGRRPAACPNCPHRARWTHNLVMALPALLRPIGFLAGLLLITASTLLVWNAADLTTGTPWFVASRLINALTVVVAIAVAFRHRFPAVHKVMSVIADISGFWPVEHHPLAGVSYRRATLEGIRHAINATKASAVVLVGHSQGSVLCAWLASGRDTEITGALSAKIDLITCGSPLCSLYAQFFPRYFDEQFFADTAKKVTWRNFWRDTDPIATALPIGDANNQRLDDPRPGGQVRGHSDYWIDPGQMSWIAARVADGQSTPVDNGPPALAEPADRRATVRGGVDEGR